MPNDGGGGGSLLSGILEPGPAARDGRWLRWGFAHRLLRKAKRNTTLQSASPRPPRLSGGMVACEPEQAGCSRCLGPPAASDRRASCRRPGFLLTCRSRRPACWRACQRAYWLLACLLAAMAGRLACCRVGAELACCRFHHSMSQTQIHGPVKVAAGDELSRCCIASNQVTTA